MTTTPATAPILRPHQQLTADFIAERPYCGVWLDMGHGKTLSTLAALMQVRPEGHMLVIAPLTIARSTWLDEIEKFDFPIRTKSLVVDERDRKLTKAKRLAAFEEVLTDPPTMYFINQELLTQSPRASCTECAGLGVKDSTCPACQNGLIDAMPTEEVDGRIRRVWPFPTVIIDESQGFKSHSSKRFKALAGVRPAISRLVELSGTPATNGLEDLWSQMYLLDKGQALGQNITEYRNRWFTPQMVPGTNTPAKWIPNAGAEEEIHAAIAHLVMSTQNTEMSLPDLHIADVPVTLDKPLMEAYKTFKRDLVLDILDQRLLTAAGAAFEAWLTTKDSQAVAIRDELAGIDDESLREALYTEHLKTYLAAHKEDLTRTVVAENQAVLTSKLMQFASGTIYTADPDDPSTAGDYEVVHTEKLAAVKDLIKLAGGEPILLAYHFRSDRTELLTHLGEAGIDVRAFDGSRGMIRAWNAREIQVMLIHPGSAGHGLNLQAGGSKMIWYTLPFRLEHYLQTNKRLHRPGQREPVTILRLLTKGTQDERMPVVLAEKRRIQDRLITAVDITAQDTSLAALNEELAEDMGLADEVVEGLTTR